MDIMCIFSFLHGSASMKSAFSFALLPHFSDHQHWPLQQPYERFGETGSCSGLEILPDLERRMFLDGIWCISKAFF